MFSIQAIIRGVWSIFGFSTNSLVSIGSEEKFLSETVCCDTSNNIFSSIETMVVSLRISSGDKALKICENIGKNIDGLIACANRTIQDLSVKEAGLAKRLVDTDTKCTDANQRWQKSSKFWNELNGRRSRLEGQRNSLEKDVSSINGDIKRLETDKELSDTRRVDALTDLIPFVGLIGGFVTGRYERAIPFYSQIRGAVSLAQEESEYYQSQLNSKQSELRTLKGEVSEISSEIDKNKPLMISLEAEAQRFKSERDGLDVEIKQLGKVITSLKNVKMSLQTIRGKYRFLSEDLNLVRDFIDDAEAKTELTQQFARALAEIKRMINCMIEEEAHSLFAARPLALESQKQLYQRLFKLFTSDKSFEQLGKSIAEELSTDSRTKIYYYTYLICKNKGCDTSDPDFGKHVIERGQVPLTVVKHAILECAFQSNLITRGSDLLKEGTK